MEECFGQNLDDEWLPTIETTETSTDAVPVGEKYAMHIENKIRAENGLPLRTSYTTNNQ